MRGSYAGVAAAILVVAFLGIATRNSRVDAVREAPAVVEVEGDTLRVTEIPAEAALFLEQGRAWRAARVLRSYFAASRTEPTPDELLVAARAEAAWGGWAAAREYLEGRTWLDDSFEGDGWFWLARARDETDDDRGALEAYDRYLAVAAGAGRQDREAVAELRRALVLLRMGRVEEGAAGLTRVRARATSIGPWADLLAAEALASAGDTSAVRAAASALPSGSALAHRGRVALVRAYRAAGDAAGALRAARDRRGGASATQRAQLAFLAGEAAIALADEGAARAEFRAALDAAPGSSYARDAADRLVGLGGLTRADRLVIADVDERHGNRERAAQGYRAWLAGTGGTAAERQDVQLRLGRTLFNAGDFAAAETALRPLAEAAPAVARQALLLTGRAQYRRGNEQQAFRTFDQLATRFPGSVEGSEGMHLIADLRHDGGDEAAAATVYRRVADGFAGTDRAGLSLMRLAGIRYRRGEYLAAAAVWEEYRSAYPRGERWLESTYWAARSYEEAGQRERARSLYEAIRTRDPLSYYAVRAAERLGAPYWPIPMAASPPADSSAIARVDGWMRTVDLLRDAGLHSDADVEVQRIADRAGSDPAVLYALAEALNDRGYSIHGIRVGQRLQQGSQGLNPRLLRILYPFPYRTLFETEAVEKKLDPFVVAALARQESLFTPRISSPVGARGLMQIMPETGRAIARGIGLDEWDAELLFNPEINVHLGTIYLAEQMDRYDESLPSVFSAYNAGPHRIEAWKSYPEFGDEELFTERIPFRETRDYVKILTRNIELYRGLYGGAAEPARVPAGASAGG